MLGLPELLVLGSVIVLIVNRKRLPSLFGEVSRSVKSFKEGVNEDEQRPLREVEELNSPNEIKPPKD
jgi:sec-independent protein translocase protein TatA